jgi:hypothetical protein
LNAKSAELPCWSEDAIFVRVVLKADVLLRRLERVLRTNVCKPSDSNCAFFATNAVKEASISGSRVPLMYVTTDFELALFATDSVFASEFALSTWFYLRLLHARTPFGVTYTQSRGCAIDIQSAEDGAIPASNGCGQISGGRVNRLEVRKDRFGGTVRQVRDSRNSGGEEKDGSEFDHFDGILVVNEIIVRLLGEILDLASGDPRGHLSSRHDGVPCAI